MTKSKNYLLAGLLGSVAGVLGGLLLAPKKGEETRNEIKVLAEKIAKELKDEKITKQRVTEIFGQTSDKAMLQYRSIKSDIASKLAGFKKAGERIGVDKYGRVVEEVVEGVQNDLKLTKNGLEKLTAYLKDDWKKVRTIVGFEEKRVVKKLARKPKRKLIAKK